MRWFRRRRDSAPAIPADDHLQRQLVNAADWAITAARRAVDPGVERPRVTVADDAERLYDDFRIAAIPPARVAAVLRERYELRAAALDMDTDAYDHTDTHEGEPDR